MTPVSPRYRIAFTGGTLLLRRGRWRAAAFLLSRAIKAAPEDWEAHNNLAVALLKQERWEEAAGMAQRAIQLRPAAVDSHDLFGIALLQLGRWEEAAVAYRRALAVDPGRYDVHDRLGMALWRLQRWEEVVAVYEAALRLNAGPYTAHHRLGVALGQLGRWAAAAAELRRAIALAEADPGAAADVGGMRLSLTNAEAQCEAAAAERPASSGRDVLGQPGVRAEQHLGPDVFAVERWLHELAVVPDRVPPGPGLLFVLDNDFGELTTVEYLLLGQALAGRARLLLPERLYAHNWSSGCGSGAVGW
jgi:tetratricopeptide (TPR) repeat protein